jgi:hypothetical protein
MKAASVKLSSKVLEVEQALGWYKLGQILPMPCTCVSVGRVYFTPLMASSARQPINWG